MIPAAYERSGERLSRVQKHILLRAYRNRLLERRTPENPGADLYYAEILSQEYGFPLAWSSGERTPDSIGFDRQEIGLAHYAAAQSSVSRAIARLHKRGLIIRQSGSHSRWAGCSLTLAGLVITERLIAGIPNAQNG